MRRWLRLGPVAGAVLLAGLLGAGPAAAQQGPDHLHVDLSLVACGTVQATGFKLPASARLQLRFEDVANGADGTLVLKAKVPSPGSRTSA